MNRDYTTPLATPVKKDFAHSLVDFHILVNRGFPVSLGGIPLLIRDCAADSECLNLSAKSINPWARITYLIQRSAVTPIPKTPDTVAGVNQGLRQ